MPNASILRTIVTPDASGAAVELLISDGSLLDETPDMRITLAIRVSPAYQTPLVAHYEREAMKIAQAALRKR